MSKENKPPENVFRSASSLQQETFCGLLEDPHLKPILAIDRFEESLHDCKVFLLSHHHWDHMKGLKNFVEKLHSSSDHFIYCSALTKEFLCNLSYGISPEKVIMLEINQPMNVYQLHNSFLAVTALPAAHCPGSVMFLIEYNDKKILYTGDFRMDLNYFIKSQKYLVNDDNTFKGVDDLYLDSTFALPSAFDDFPPREDSEKLIVDLIESWFVRSSGKVIIQIPACIGSETIFITLSEKFKTKIYVHDDNFKHFYKAVEGLNSCFKPTDDIVNDTNWLLHACRDTRCINSLVTKNFQQVRVIKPCALSFVRGDDASAIQYKNGVPYILKDRGDFSLVKVLYSGHSSLNELIEIVDFIQPQRIFYNTSYKGFHEKMNKWIVKKKEDENGNCVEKQVDVKVKPLILSDNDCANHEKEREHVAKKLKLFL